MAKPILYSYYRSSCSWRVRAALEYKGINYEYVPVKIMKSAGEQHKADYMKINPMAQVPALITDGQNLIQSVSILEYLEETHPDPALLPKGLIARAKVRAITECITSGIQPLQNSSILDKINDEFGTEKKDAWARDLIARGLQGVEDILEKTAGKYCVADELSFADICLVPQVYNAVRYKVDLSPFPIIRRLNAELMQEAAFIKSHPANQPDCPPEQRGGF